MTIWTVGAVPILPRSSRRNSRRLPGAGDRASKNCNWPLTMRRRTAVLTPKATCVWPVPPRSISNPSPTRPASSKPATPSPIPQPTLSPEQRQELLDQIDQTLESEIALARELFSLVQQDSRIGFEPSCQYFYLPLDLVEKVIDCRWLQEYFSGEEKAVEG